MNGSPVEDAVGIYEIGIRYHYRNDLVGIDGAGLNSGNTKNSNIISGGYIRSKIHRHGRRIAGIYHTDMVRIGEPKFFAFVAKILAGC